MKSWKGKADPTFFAALMMVCASASFAVMGGFVKALHRLPSIEITFFRALVNVVALLPWALRHKSIVATCRKEPIALLVRGVSGGSSAMLYFYAIEHIRLADAVTLNQSSPIVVLLLSAIFLGERLNLARVLCVLIAFVGILFVIKPDFTVHDAGERLGALAGLASIFMAAIAYVSIKVATSRQIPTRLIVLTFAIVASLITLPFALWFYEPPIGLEWLLLLGAGISATIAQETMTRGYAGLPASVASPILFSTVIFSSIIGWAIWREIPDQWSLLGMTLIAVGLFCANRFKPVD